MSPQEQNSQHLALLHSGVSARGGLLDWVQVSLYGHPAAAHTVPGPKDRPIITEMSEVWDVLPSGPSNRQRDTEQALTSGSLHVPICEMGIMIPSSRHCSENLRVDRMS